GPAQAPLAAVAGDMAAAAGELVHRQQAVVGAAAAAGGGGGIFQIHYLIQRQHRSEEHTSELQSRFDLVCRLVLEKEKIDREDALTRRGGIPGWNGRTAPVALLLIGSRRSIPRSLSASIGKDKQALLPLAESCVDD